MKMVDLASAIAPGVAHEMVGIRPGEKLHEVMITSDDARNTLELADRYVIAPAFPFWTRDHLDLKGAAKVSDEFRYASDSNGEWLTAASLGRMLERAGLG
jgi:UDP-N-acetylglucosamine 4,6-dehydratase